jgi:Rad/Gem-related GTP binding protein 1
MEELSIEDNEKIKRSRSFRSRPDRSTEGLRRVRSFKTTSKGLVNRGDSVKVNRGTPHNSPGHRNKVPGDGDTRTDSPKIVNSLEIPSFTASDNDCHQSNFKVLITGVEGVGKSSIIDQFMTSEFLGHGHLNVCK